MAAYLEWCLQQGTADCMRILVYFFPLEALMAFQPQSKTLAEVIKNKD